MNYIFTRKVTSYDIREISDFLDRAFIQSNVYRDSEKKHIILLKPNLIMKQTKEID